MEEEKINTGSFSRLSGEQPTLFPLPHPTYRTEFVKNAWTKIREEQEAPHTLVTSTVIEPGQSRLGYPTTPLGQEGPIAHASSGGNVFHLQPAVSHGKSGSIEEPHVSESGDTTPSSSLMARCGRVLTVVVQSILGSNTETEDPGSTS